MLLLSVDTSGKQGSIALAQCGPAAECEVIGVVPLAGGTFSAQLVPQIAELLAQHGLSKQSIGAFAVVSGPGSFTGLRVGLTAIKALAEVLRKPIAAISLLQAVAYASGKKGRVLAALDAGRNEIYAGQYQLEASVEMLSERLQAHDEFLSSAGASGSAIVTPDASIAQLARSSNLDVEEIERPRSDVVARLGYRKIRAGEIVSPENLEANYIRCTDAEIFSKPGS